MWAILKKLGCWRLIRKGYPDMRGKMMQVNQKLTVLLLILLSSCTGSLQRQDESADAVERQEQKKETKPPTFIYRPGV
jgi:hypothetical protein